jgi:release factor glutamine methyltransferase
MTAEMPTPEGLLDVSHYGAARLAIGKILHWRYRVFQHRYHDNRVVLERIGDFPLIILPGVLNPRLTRSGAFFASQLSGALLGAGAKVLDMGTGCGVCAIAAARHAPRVVAVDINPTAARCAQINVLINALACRVEVLSGDLFDPVGAQRFDVVLFNPPFIHGEPRNEADRAWRSRDVVERFAADLTEHLTPKGFALLVLSTYGDGVRFLPHFQRCGFDVTILASRTFINERLFLVRLQPQRRTGTG